MEENATLAMIIGVGVLVTATIISLFMVSMDKIKEIFTAVNEQDTSIHGGFNNYEDKYIDVYKDKILTGVDLVNLLKKVEEENEYTVNVYYVGNGDVRKEARINGKTESQILQQLMEAGETLGGVKYTYYTQYSVDVTIYNDTIFIYFF